ncbi:glycosyltransferase [Thalassotalea sp. HSM 43]|uniref:glycosyltransferase n=1 Tax=Thalassotalea sp. HSM 43 TaxID=2552945 RepID=UPI001E42C5CB|nr:glycosyltransferase [Thalassotalea sp. HSM 43]
MSKPIKVSMIVWNPFTNDARVLKEAETLVTNGYQVTVFALFKAGVNVEHDVLPSGVIVRRIDGMGLFRRKNKGHAQSLSMKPLAQLSRLAKRVGTIFSMIAAVSRSKPDIIHAHDVNVLVTAYVASKMCAAKLVYDAHEISTDREGYRPFRKVVGCIEKTLTPKVAAMITTTDVRAKFFRLAYKVPRPTVLQNRPTKSFAEPQQSNHIRDTLNLQQSWPIALYQGMLQPGRGLERLVQVAQHIDEVYFVFIGGGRIEDKLKQLVANLGISDRVHFIATVPLADLPLYTASATFGVQPIENTCLNHYSTDSNKLFEYILAGLPVISTGFPEIRKVIEQYQLGLAIKDNPQDLQQAIVQFRDNPELLQHYAANTHAAVEQLCWEEQEHKLLELYQRVQSAV